MTGNAICGLICDGCGTPLRCTGTTIEEAFDALTAAIDREGWQRNARGAGAEADLRELAKTMGASTWHQLWLDPEIPRVYFDLCPDCQRDP